MTTPNTANNSTLTLKALIDGYLSQGSNGKTTLAAKFDWMRVNMANAQHAFPIAHPFRLAIATILFADRTARCDAGISCYMKTLSSREVLKEMVLPLAKAIGKAGVDNEADALTLMNQSSISKKWVEAYRAIEEERQAKEAAFNAFRLSRLND